jgi:Zn-dependent protease with chaperone function
MLYSDVFIAFNILIIKYFIYSAIALSSLGVYIEYTNGVL